MEAYKKVGRGGAGNFYSKKDIEVASKTGDIESQTPPTTALPTPNPPTEYMHSGRGGAGNWVKPSELQSQGLSQITPTNADNNKNPTSTTSLSTKKVSAPTYYRGGRGGAGNLRDVEAEERLVREEEERKRRELEGRVVRDVEAGLARPERSYGGAGGAWEMK